ncbi:hypothetical protein RFI_31569 [Reticulomyxa filosa]|uniref:Uncharacterized protein n=1 Tax=Reticulomyxa filosa TaxID=46433 RepID=X6LYM4_RETFI|nr:hypothetical protein RFI_31569 [Reticulomyxa filosa]|eukprot:ETO05825.1 hypothetical protein RFI_31569 [Reticulomyxa filosa]
MDEKNYVKYRKSQNFKKVQNKKFKRKTQSLKKNELQHQYCIFSNRRKEREIMKRKNIAHILLEQINSSLCEVKERNIEIQKFSILTDENYKKIKELIKLQRYCQNIEINKIIIRYAGCSCHKCETNKETCVFKKTRKIHNNQLNFEKLKGLGKEKTLYFLFQFFLPLVRISVEGRSLKYANFTFFTKSMHKTTTAKCKRSVNVCLFKH